MFAWPSLAFKFVFRLDGYCMVGPRWEISPNFHVAMVCMYICSFRSSWWCFFHSL